LFIYVHSKREQKKSYPLIKFTVLPFWHCYFESSNHKYCSKCPPSASRQADRRRLHSSMDWSTTSKQWHVYYVISNTFFKQEI